MSPIKSLSGGLEAADPDDNVVIHGLSSDFAQLQGVAVLGNTDLAAILLFAHIPLFIRPISKVLGHIKRF